MTSTSFAEVSQILTQLNIYYEELSAEEIADKIINYKPIQL